MINEIKTIVQNCISSAKLCKIMTGTISSGGVQINEKFFIPDDLIIGNLKNSVITGQKVRLLRDHGGQLFYILEVIV